MRNLEIIKFPAMASLHWRTDGQILRPEISILLGLLDPEDKDITIFRNVRNYLPVERTQSLIKKSFSYAALLWEFLIFE